MSSSNPKTVVIQDNTIIVQGENQEVPEDSIVHCLRSLFKVTSSGLSHVIGKIDDNTYFVDPKYFRKLNEFTFSDQPEVNTTLEIYPRSEDLLASAYRLMTAPFAARTPKNVTTRNRQ